MSDLQDETSFIVNAARVKMGEISVQLAREENHIKNKKSVAELYVQILSEWLDKSQQQRNGGVSESRYAELQHRRTEMVKALFAARDEGAAGGNDFKSRLICFYQKYKPDKVGTVDETLTKFAGKEEEMFKTLVAKYGPEPTAAPTQGLFDRAFVVDTLSADVFNGLRAQTERFCINTLHDTITAAEVRSSATTLLSAREFSPDQERLLRRAEEEGSTIGAEYVSLVNILLKNFTDWQWKEPMEGRVLYYHVPDKLRILTSGDILESLFHEVLAQRWAAHLDNHVPEWKKVTNSSDNDDYLFDVHNTDGYVKAFWEEETTDTCWSDFGSRTSDYNNGAGESDSTTDLMMTIAGVSKYEEELPSPSGQPLGLIQSDIAELGNSISHELLITIMECIGATPKWCAFFKKYCSGWRITVGGREYTPSHGRGLLLAHTLTHVCTELALYLLDVAMGRAGYPIMRSHDDFIMCARGATELERAWTTCTETIQKLGLRPNMTKTRGVFLTPKKKEGQEQTVMTAVKVGSPLVDIMGKGFTLRGLKLDGGWQINSDALTRLVHPLQPADDSVLAHVQNYSMQLTTLRQQLGPASVLLGPEHAKAVVDTMIAAERRLCGIDSMDTAAAAGVRRNRVAEPPLVAWLSKEISARFASLAVNSWVGGFSGPLRRVGSTLNTRRCERPPWPATRSSG